MFKKAITSAKNKLLAGLIALFSSNIFAAWDDLNMTEGVTAISKEVFDLHMLIFWICVVIGLVVFGIMFYSMFAFTKKKNPNPATFHENTKVELAWTVVPFLILVEVSIMVVGDEYPTGIPLTKSVISQRSSMTWARGR